MSILCCIKAQLRQSVEFLIWIYHALDLTEASLATSMLVTLATGLLAVFISTVLWRRHWEQTKDPASHLPLPPGSFGWPLFGETLDFLLLNYRPPDRKRLQHGGIYKSHLFGSPMVRTSSGEQIAHFMSKETHSLTMYLPKSSRFVLGEAGVIVLSGERHAVMKRNLKEAFTPVRLGDYLPGIQACVRRHISSWLQGSGEEKLLGYKVCQELVCDLILETIVGCNKEHDPSGKVREAFVVCNDNLFCIPINIPGFGFYKSKRARQVVVEFVKDRLLASQASGQDHVTVLDILVAHQRAQKSHLSNNNDVHDKEEPAGGGFLSDAELIDNAVTLLVAGADTVSSALCSVLDMLGTYPDTLEAVRRELASQDLLHSDHDNDLTYEHLQNLPYVRAVSREILRICPPVGASFRYSTRTIETEQYQIPAKWRVMYGIRNLHSDTEAFADKKKFIPERWLDKNIEEKLRKEFPCYAPFGFGSRTCLGKELALLEMNVFVVEVARLADWTLLNPGARRVVLPTHKPFDNLPMTCKKR